MKRGVGRVPKKTQGVIFSLSRKMCEGISAEGPLKNGGNRAKTEACFYDINVPRCTYVRSVERGAEH